MKKRFVLILTLIVLLGGVGLRFMHMTADPPTDLSVSGGILGDGGLYAYAARNLVLFNKTGFAGYEPIAGTPLMTYVNYLVYQVFGIDFFTHRIIPVLFSIFCLLFLFFLARKYLGKWPAFFASLFFSLNYPVLIYSKTANRQFPTLFFLLLSFYFFIRGAETKKNLPFFWTAIFFACSFLSRGTALFALPVFFVVGLVWLLEKKINWQNVLTLAGSLAVFGLAWRWLVYLPYSTFIDGLIGHNKAAGTVISLSGLIHDILHHPLRLLDVVLKSPFMVQFRSDPSLWFFCLAAMMIYVYLRLQKKGAIPYILDLAFAWMLVIIGKNALFTYRPERHYLDLVAPAAILAGWFMKKWLDREIKLAFNARLVAAVLFTVVLVFPFGIIKYGRYLAGVLFHDPVQTGFYLLILASFLLLFARRDKKIFPATFIILCLVFSAYLNLNYFTRWAHHRTYQAVHISGVFGKAIPPSFVAGNWVLLLATGTPHKTTLAWPGQINWYPDFLRKNGLEYVMVSDFSPDGYLAYRRMFKQDLDNATLLAIFELHKKNLYFFKLEKDPQPLRLEFEAFYRDKLDSNVIYGKDLSRRMGVGLKPLPHVSYSLYRDFQVPATGDYTFSLKARGHFMVEISIQDGDKILTRREMIIKGEAFQEKTFAAALPGETGLRLNFRVHRLRGAGVLDYIELKSMREPVMLPSPFPVTDRLGNRRDYRVFLPDRPEKSKGLPLLVYFHAVMSPGFQARVPALKHYTGSPVEETGLIELGQRDPFILLVPTALYEFKSLKNCLARGWDIDREIDGIEKMIDGVAKAYGVPREKVYLTGISAGAVLCHHLANRRPERYSAILSHSQAYTGKDGKGSVRPPVLRGPQFGVLFAYNQGDYPDLIKFCEESYRLYKDYGYKTELLPHVPPIGHAWSAATNDKFWRLLQSLGRKVD